VKPIDRREIRPDGWGISLVEAEPGRRVILLDAPRLGGRVGLSLAQAAHLARSIDALLGNRTTVRGITVRFPRRPG
jgi:hypothetical protein